MGTYFKDSPMQIGSNICVGIMLCGGVYLDISVHIWHKLA
jgi:hypothetical protein